MPNKLSLQFSYLAAKLQPVSTYSLGWLVFSGMKRMPIKAAHAPDCTARLEG